jgi:hypothetical protein
MRFSSEAGRVRVRIIDKLKEFVLKNRILSENFFPIRE